MTENDPLTPDKITEWAEGVLSMWLTGYTDPLEDGRQRKIIEFQDDTYNVYCVKDYDGSNPDRVFRIAVTVEEVK